MKLLWDVPSPFQRRTSLPLMDRPTVKIIFERTGQALHFSTVVYIQSAESRRRG